jgi:hypothetical protein
MISMQFTLIWIHNWIFSGLETYLVRLPADAPKYGQKNFVVIKINKHKCSYQFGFHLKRVPKVMDWFT